MPRKRFENALCAFCGKNPSTVGKGEHVIANMFFEHRHRNDDYNFVRVPSCRECNSGFQSDEEYVRTLFAPTSPSNHPTAHKLSNDQVLRSLDRNEAPWKKISKSAIPMTQEVCGINLGITYAFRADHSTIRRVMIKIVKGLFFYYQQTRMPDECDFGILPLKREDYQDAQLNIQLMGNTREITMVDGVFRCSYLIQDDVSRWLALCRIERVLVKR